MSEKLPDDKDGLLNLIKKLWLPVAGFLGAITVAYNFYKVWLGDRATVTYFLAGGGLMVLIITLAWVALSRKTIKRQAAVPFGRIQMEKVAAYPLKYRRAAWVALSLIFIGLAWGGYALAQRRQAEQLAQQTQATLQAQATQTAKWVRQTLATQRALAAQVSTQTQQAQVTQYVQATQTAQQAMREKLVVVIAAFDGTEEVYGFRNQILESLNAAFSQDDEIEIVAVSDRITPDMGSVHARALGEQLIADLVIWGWYRPTENPNIHIHIENLAPTQIEILQESETYVPQANLAQLESFEIQRQLGSETSTLIAFLVGMLKYKSGDYPSAIEWFEQILSHHDISTFISDFDVFYNLGYCYLQSSSYEHSIRYYNQAIEVDQESADAYNNRGLSFYLLGEYERSIQDFDKAIELNPQHAIAYNNRGTSHYELKEYEAAVQDFNKSIEFDPQYIPAYYNRGIAFRRFKEFERSIQDFDKAIELNPQYKFAYVGRGLSYYDLGEYERSIQEYDKAIELDPGYATTYKNRGKAYQALGKTTEAEADFKKYEELTGQKP